MTAPEPDYYGLLEIPRTASDGEIRAAYRRLARQHHPDANPDPAAESRMRRLNEAWETLRDPERRSLYDRRLPRAAAPARPSRPMRRPAAPAAPRPRPQAPWFTEDAPREDARPGATFTGDATIDWYAKLGVRPTASRQEILKALSRLAAELSGADISATEFTRRRNEMREAWAVLGDQHVRASYDRARKASAASPAPASAAAPNPPRGAVPPPGYRTGPAMVNGLAVDAGAALAGADLRGADLRGLDLAGIDLSGARLQGADLEAASLRRANLSGADLSGATLRHADLSNANAAGATLRQADLSGAALHATNFFRANLAGARLAAAVAPGVNLDYADLSRADFSGATVTTQLIERGRRDGTIMPDGSIAP